MGHARHDALARCSERQRDDLVEKALDLREEAVYVAHADHEVDAVAHALDVGMKAVPVVHGEDGRRRADALARGARGCARTAPGECLASPVGGGMRLEFCSFFSSAVMESIAEVAAGGSAASATKPKPEEPSGLVPPAPPPPQPPPPPPPPPQPPPPPPPPPAAAAAERLAGAHLGLGRCRRRRRRCQTRARGILCHLHKRVGRDGCEQVEQHGRRHRLREGGLGDGRAGNEQGEREAWQSSRRS